MEFLGGHLGPRVTPSLFLVEADQSLVNFHQVAPPVDPGLTVEHGCEAVPVSFNQSTATMGLSLHIERP